MLFIDEVHRFNKTQQDPLLAPSRTGACCWSPRRRRTRRSRWSPRCSPARSCWRCGRCPTTTCARCWPGVPRRAAWRGGHARAGGRDASSGWPAGTRAARSQRSRRRQTSCGGERERRRRPTVERAVDRGRRRYDRAGDQHYDVMSAFIKSIRGSDVDAALHYLARMLEAGEDPRFVARRLIVHASEDIGWPTRRRCRPPSPRPGRAADRHAGGPDRARARRGAPRDRAQIQRRAQALGDAAGDVRDGLGGAVPRHLRDSHYAGAERLGNALGTATRTTTPAGRRPSSTRPTRRRPRLLRPTDARRRARHGRAPSRGSAASSAASGVDAGQRVRMRPPAQQRVALDRAAHAPRAAAAAAQLPARDLQHLDPVSRAGGCWSSRCARR